MTGPDLTRLPTGQQGWAAFVEGLKTLDDGHERHFLEFKSDVDPSSKPGAAKIAKFILGASNRLPDVANRYLGGHALLVVGILNGNIEGIPTFELNKLQNEVCKFIGVPGNCPAWDFQLLSVGDDGKIVFIVIVSPPKLTDPIWTCLSDGLEGLFNGRTYVRVEGATREAHGDEVRLLWAEKTKAAARPEADLAVSIVGSAKRYVCDSLVLDEYIVRERERLIEALPAESNRSQFSVTNAYLVGDFTRFADGRIPEKRTRDQYLKQIDDWEAAVRRAWDDALSATAAFAWRAIKIQVVNRSELFMEDVKLKVHIGGDIVGIPNHNGSDGFRFHAELPKPPRVWGPVPMELFRPPVMDYAMAELSRPRREIGVVRFTNGGSVNLSLTVGDLRPLDTFDSDDDDLLLIANNHDTAQFVGTWSITARGHDRRYTGELVVEVEPGVADFSEYVRKALGLDNDPVE